MVWAVRKRSLVFDPEPVKTVRGLTGQHGRAVIGHQAARQASLLKCLAQPIKKRIGCFIEIPLQVAADTRRVVEYAECLGGVIVAAHVYDLQASGMEIKMP